MKILTIHYFFHTKASLELSKMFLSNYQKEDIKAIIDERIKEMKIFETMIQSTNPLIEQEIRDKITILVPEICHEWINRNIKFETEFIINEYLKNNFTEIFRKEISENKNMNNFIDTHLQSIENRIEEAANATVKRIVDTTGVYNPIFQSQVAILSEKNKNMLETQNQELRDNKNMMMEQTKELQQNKTILNAVVEQNETLKDRINRLESSNKLFQGIVTFSLGIIGIGLGIRFFMHKSRRYLA
jgi:hypothetical protein